MQKSPGRLRRTLRGAVIASLLLHMAGIFSEEIYTWLTLPEFEQTALQKTRKKLESQRLDKTNSTELAQVIRPESLEIYLRQPAALKPSKPARTHVTPRKGVIPAPRPPKTPVHTALASAPVQGNLFASTPVDALTASHIEALVPPEILASAPIAVHASQPVDKMPPGALQRFPSALEITYVYGVIPATMSWKIVDGRYNLRLAGGFMGTSRVFESRGRVDQQGVKPDQFVEYRNAKPEPYFQTDFDWNQMTAQIGELGKRKTETFAQGDQDIFSAAFHIGLVGEFRPEQTFSIFSGRKKYENAQLHLAGEAVLRLGSKEIDALLLRGQWGDRQVDFWLAPEWHNIPVRMTIMLGKELTLDIWANEITLDGKKVLEWVKIQNKHPGEGSNR